MPEIDRERWVKINDLYYDVYNCRAVYVQGANHPGNAGLPYISVEFMRESTPPNCRDGYGKNVKEKEAAHLIETYPTRQENGEFYRYLTKLI